MLMPFKMNLRPMMRSMAPIARDNMPQGGLGMAAPRTATGYPIPQNPMMASPGGGGGFDERTGTYTKPRNPIFNALRNINIPMTGGAPNTAPGIFGGMQPRTVTPEEAMAITSLPATRAAPTQPATTSFDRNAALQAFNARAAEMNSSGNGLFNSGMSPDEFRMYQGVLRNLQLNPNSTPEQHNEILNKSMAFLNQYGGTTPKPMVDPNVPYRPTGPDAFYGTQPTPDVYVRPAPRMETPMPEPTMPTTPAFDPNRALNDYNNRLAGIYAGGGNMDMNMIRAQQANLRNLQLDRNATAEQHDAAYRAALSELRSRYPDAFAG